MKYLKPHLPLWLSLDVSGEPVYDVMPRVDILIGLQAAAIPSCSAAPVFDDHQYVVVEIRNNIVVGILDDSVVLDSSTPGRHTCVLIDLKPSPASTILVTLPDDISSELISGGISSEISTPSALPGPSFSTVKE